MARRKPLSLRAWCGQTDTQRMQEMQALRSTLPGFALSLNFIQTERYTINIKCIYRIFKIIIRISYGLQTINYLFISQIGNCIAITIFTFNIGYFLQYYQTTAFTVFSDQAGKIWHL